MDEVPVVRPGWKKALPAIASVLVILIGVLLIVQPSLPTPIAPAAPAANSSGGLGRIPAAGERVPDFELKTLAGGTVKMSDLRGSPVIINFWATWCGPCKQEMPYLVDAYNWNKAKGLRVLAIDSVAFDNLDDIKAFVKQYEMTFDVLLDEDDVLSADWAIMGLPSSFFIRPDGTIAKVHVGQMSVDQVSEYLKMIMPNG